DVRAIHISRNEPLDPVDVVPQRQVACFRPESRLMHTDGPTKLRLGTNATSLEGFDGAGRRLRVSDAVAGRLGLGDNRQQFGAIFWARPVVARIGVAAGPFKDSPPSVDFANQIVRLEGYGPGAPPDLSQDI